MITRVISRHDDIFDREIESQQFVIDRIDIISIRSTGTDFNNIFFCVLASSSSSVFQFLKNVSATFPVTTFDVVGSTYSSEFRFN